MEEYVPFRLNLSLDGRCGTELKRVCQELASIKPFDIDQKKYVQDVAAWERGKVQESTQLGDNSNSLGWVSYLQIDTIYWPLG